MGTPGNEFRIAFGGAILGAVVFAALSIGTLMSSAREARVSLIRMTDAYMSAYADTGAMSAAVPAEFRRDALARFSKSGHRLGEGSLSMRMPGVPGREVGTVEQNPAVAGLIAEQADRGTIDPVDRVAVEGGSIVARTVYPSIAASAECVSCHNRIDPESGWKIGDTMGAFVVESDLTGPLWQIALRASGVFLIGFIALRLSVAREIERRLRVRTALAARADAEARRDQAENLALRDALTGIGNRLALTRAAKEALASDDGVYVCLVDLDKFKSVNDVHGHEVGDILLKRVAERLDRILTAHGGVAFRLGGDEFAGLVRLGPGAEAPQALGAQIAREVAQPVLAGDLQLAPSCSVGAAASMHLGTVDLSALLRAADRALYDAKGQGGNSDHFYSERLRREDEREAALRDAVPQAIADGSLKLLYQPQVDLETGELVGLEALLRWEHAGVLLEPGDFLPILEVSGQIRVLDLWVLDAALTQLARWQDQGVAGSETLRISVNVSAAHFRTDEIIGQIEAVLARTGLTADRLILEMKEAHILEAREEATAVMRRLRGLGVGVALDDFGTGYSSLSCLRQFPVSEVKIDHTFTVDIETCDETRFLVEGVIDITEALGMRLVVEGIESRGQCEALQAIGARTGQGYLFAPPLGAEAAGDFVASRTRGIDIGAVPPRDARAG